MSEQTRIKPLEQAYHDEWGTERTEKDRPNYKHWLEQRVTQLEAESKKSRDDFVELFEYMINFEPFKTWIKEIDDLKESE